MRAITSILAVFGLTTCCASLAYAQTQSVQVPPGQRELSTILSKYNDLRDEAPNRIQRDRVEAEFKRALCAKIPKGDVSGWYGTVDTISNRTPDGSLNLSLSVDVFDTHGSGLGVGLWVRNFYAYGIYEGDVQAHQPTSIPTNSPLFEITANLRDGDVVRFDATLIPRSSDQACYNNSNLSSVALVRFNRIQKIGWNVHLE